MVPGRTRGRGRGRWKGGPGCASFGRTGLEFSVGRGAARRASRVLTAAGWDGAGSLPCHASPSWPPPHPARPERPEWQLRESAGVPGPRRTPRPRPSAGPTQPAVRAAPADLQGQARLLPLTPTAPVLGATPAPGGAAATQPSGPPHTALRPPASAISPPAASPAALDQLVRPQAPAPQGPPVGVGIAVSGQEGSGEPANRPLTHLVLGQEDGARLASGSQLVTAEPAPQRPGFMPGAGTGPWRAVRRPGPARGPGCRPALGSSLPLGSRRPPRAPLSRHRGVRGAPAGNTALRARTQFQRPCAPAAPGVRPRTAVRPVPSPPWGPATP